MPLVKTTLLCLSNTKDSLKIEQPVTLRCRSRTPLEVRLEVLNRLLEVTPATVLKSSKLMETYLKLGSVTLSLLYTRTKLYYSVELLAIPEGTR